MDPGEKTRDSPPPEPSALIENPQVPRGTSARPPATAASSSLIPLYKTEEPLSEHTLRRTLSGNEFSSSDLTDGSGPPAPAEGHDQQGARLGFLEQEGGERRQLGDEDIAHRGREPEEEADQKDEFASIVTVDDFGFAAWSQQSFQEQSAPTALVVGEPGTPGNDVLAGVGGVSASVPPGSSASARDVENSLEVEIVGDEVRDSLQTSKVSDSRFLPLDRFREIMNDAVVRRLLRNVAGITEEQLDKRTREVCGAQDDPSMTTRRKIFTILVLIGKVESILGFIHDDIRDIHLPLKMEWNDKRKYSIKKRGDIELASTSACFRNWLKRDLEAFQYTQTFMLAPYFELRGDRVFFYLLDERQIVLPYTEYEHKTHGGHGRVIKVKMHKAHHNFRSTTDFPDDNPYFAVKEIHSNNPADYYKEVEVLEKFSGQNKGHEHVIRLLLTYRHDEKYYLVFHWANGNLKEYWEQNPDPAMTKDNVVWLINQCRGLAQGLRKVHHVTSWPREEKGNGTAREKDWGRHGDIKPENILWFMHKSDGVRLVISDFGLARLHSSHSRSNVPHDQVPGHSNTYRPPEYDLKLAVSQRYDVWTLGCLYLEFLSWFLRGDTETQQNFCKARLKDDKIFQRELREDKFFNVYLFQGNQYRARVKDSVKKWINELHALPKCSDVFHDFLDMIELSLLVPEAKNRWDCSQICSELDKIHERCEVDTDYCVNGTVRQPASAQGIPLETFGELRVSMFLDQAPSHFPSPFENVIRSEQNAVPGVGDNFSHLLAAQDDELIERLPPAEANSPRSSVPTQDGHDLEDSGLPNMLQAGGSNKTNIETENGGATPEERGADEMIKGSGDEPTPALPHESANITNVSTQNLSGVVSSSSASTSHPRMVENSNGGVEAPAAVEESSNSITPRVKVGEQAAEHDVKPAAGTHGVGRVAHAQGRGGDHGSPIVQGDNQKHVVEHAETSQEPPKPSVITGDAPAQIQPVRGRIKTSGPSVAPADANDNTDDAVDREMKRPVPGDLPHAGGQPRRGRSRRYWDQLMDEYSSRTGLWHVGGAIILGLTLGITTAALPSLDGHALNDWIALYLGGWIAGRPAATSRTTRVR